LIWEVLLMRLQPSVLSLVVVVAVIGIPQHAEADAVLFNNRAAFDAALNGEYQLFTDFEINFQNPPAFIVGGNYGGLLFSDDEAYIGFGETLSFFPPIGSHSTGPCCTSVTRTVTAVGFDVIASEHHPESGPPTSVPLFFGFSTNGGLGATVTVLPGTFVGLLLIDDTLAEFSLINHDADTPFESLSGTLIAIDNLAVQTVPEPSTLLLFGMAAGAVRVAARKRIGAGP
jgi:hypothetical protein